MKVSTYTTAWSVLTKHFDYKGALDNWATFSDEISVAVPNSDTDDSAGAIEAYARERNYNVVITRTDFDLSGADPFAYGKTENAALQACTGDLLWQQNLDERTLVNRVRLEQLHSILQRNLGVKAFWVPTIDLFGDYKRCLPGAKAKWYGHAPSLFRGAVRNGIKTDGRPDYNITSTDELLDITGNLVATMPLCPTLTLEGLKPYVADGWPLVYHLGYVDFKERLDRSVWWKDYWVKATGGDQNTHPTTIEEMAAKESVEHGLPLWPTKSVPDLAPQDFHDTTWPKP